MESYLYQNDLEDEGPDALEDAYASPILDAKYRKVDIKEVTKDMQLLSPGPRQAGSIKRCVIKT